MMNQDVKAKWVAALRSGEYKQGKEFLCKKGAYCCLGVLTDIYSREVDGRPFDGKGKRLIGADQLLPNKVAKWAGLVNRYGDPLDDAEVTIQEENSYLSHHNDSGRTFKQIAKAIEKQL